MMNEDLIELPNITDIKELLVEAKGDIQEELKEDPSLLDQSQLLIDLMEIIEEKISSQKNIDKMDLRSKIDLAAHLNYLHTLLDDFFLASDFDFGIEEDEDGELIDMDDLYFVDEEEEEEEEHRR